MRKSILYIHGKGGNAQEAEQFKDCCLGYDIHGINLVAFTPWETSEQIQNAYNELKEIYDVVYLIANSIGAYLSMYALQECEIENAFLISPILDMEKLILDMMKWANVSEEQLKRECEIETEFGETLSWDYLNFTRDNLVEWDCETSILYGENDNMTSRKTVNKFAETHNAILTVMKNGEHWFHTPEQMVFLCSWLKSFLVNH